MAETEATAETLNPAPHQVAAPWKYSKRVLLKTIVDREDGGLGLVGETVVIGGWVKSSNEEKTEAPHWTPTADKEAPVGPKDQNAVNCLELFQIQTHFPFFRSIRKALGGAPHPVRPRIEAPPPKPLSSIAFLKVSDGSCVTTLKVCYISNNN